MMDGVDALYAMQACHRWLVEGVDARVARLRSAVVAKASGKEEAAELSSFLSDEVLPHAIAEELTIYRTASTRSALAAVLDEMTLEHHRLASLAETLASAKNGREALAAAEQMSALLAAHLDKEDRRLLRRLYDEGRVDLSELVVDVRYATNRVRPLAELGHPAGNADAARAVGQSLV